MELTAERGDVSRAQSAHSHAVLARALINRNNWNHLCGTFTETTEDLTVQPKAHLCNNPAVFNQHLYMPPPVGWRDDLSKEEVKNVSTLSVCFQSCMISFILYNLWKYIWNSFKGKREVRAAVNLQHVHSSVLGTPVLITGCVHSNL